MQSEHSRRQLSVTAKHHELDGGTNLYKANFHVQTEMRQAVDCYILGTAYAVDIMTDDTTATRLLSTVPAQSLPSPNQLNSTQLLTNTECNPTVPYQHISLGTFQASTPPRFAKSSTFLLPGYKSQSALVLTKISRLFVLSPSIYLRYIQTTSLLRYMLRQRRPCSNPT